MNETIRIAIIHASAAAIFLAMGCSEDEATPVGIPLTVGAAAVSGSVADGSYTAYNFQPDSNTTYVIILSPTSGNPDLYVCRSSPCTSDSGDLKGSSANSTGDDTATFTTGPDYAPSTDHFGVYGSGGEATFTIAVFIRSWLTMDGASEFRSIVSGNYREYSFDGGLSEMRVGIIYTVTLAPSRGNADLYVCSNSPCNGSTYDIGASGNTGLTEDSVTFRASSSVSHHVGVEGILDADYSIAVNTSGGGNITVDVSGITSPGLVSATVYDGVTGMPWGLTDPSDVATTDTLTVKELVDYFLVGTSDLRVLDGEHYFLIVHVDSDPGGDIVIDDFGDPTDIYPTGNGDTYTAIESDLRAYVTEAVTITNATGIADGKRLHCVWHLGSILPTSDGLAGVSKSYSSTAVFSGGTTVTDNNQPILPWSYKVICVVDDDVSMDPSVPTTSLLTSGDEYFAESGVTVTGAGTVFDNPTFSTEP